jgi:Fibronectin type III domain/Bacterial Ig domain
VGLALGGILLVAPSTGAAVLDLSWIAPTTNSDGSPLTDLASYRIYFGPTDCPGTAFVQIASSTTSPELNQTVSFRLTGLTTGALYYVSVTAVNASGDESNCSSLASAVAHIDFSVSPTGPVSFGDVNVGSFMDRVFTVQNTSGGTVSGSASASAPFSIVSGSPFTLVGSGATQAVTVRFTPTASSAVITNAMFTVGGDALSRLVIGSGFDAGSSLDVSQPTITITSPTASPTYTTGNPFLTLEGTASDNVGLTWVMWISDRGASGMAIGTTNWTASGIVLRLGSNELTVVAQNVAGYITTATLTVTLSVATTFTDDPPIADPLVPDAR